jgi:hypothetical protein
MERRGTWERKILRIYGQMVEQGIWRIRTNQEMGELYKDLDTVADINRKRMEWTGHVVRTDLGRTVKNIQKSKPEGSTKGRLRFR